MAHSDSDKEAAQLDLENWGSNLVEKSEEFLSDIQSRVNVNDLWKMYTDQIDQWDEDIRNVNLYQFLATYKKSHDFTADENAGERNDDCGTEKITRKLNPRMRRLRVPRKAPVTASTPLRPRVLANAISKEIVVKTPAGNIRLPRAITPKVQDGTEFKFRALRREEIAFSVAGTPVVAIPEANSGDSSTQVVSELLHARDEDLTPNTRNAVKNMKQIIDRICPSELP